ncbi:sensor histidine kinase [Altericroceibacterium spongiae]|uniref:Sensor histidine kinase n=1 Tax=Altericroceibacterium spongiae TaxID=2320269 RepID=A0A420EEE2_9SPHN|nr:histidine kinase [Altericroceibacterium spongiae]RKF19032.1 sensor histidine kinase [Altericroceibacterium spongiae]
MLKLMEKNLPSDESIVRVPFKTVLASICGLWLCYFLLTTLRAEMFDLGYAQELLLRRALASVAGVVTTLGLWLILRLFDGRSLWTKILVALIVSAPVALVLAESNRLAFADMEDRIMQRVAEQQGLEMRRNEAGDIMLYLPGSAMGGSSGMPGEAPPGGAITIDQQKRAESATQQLMETAFGRYFMMLTWCALYLALLTGEKARAAERREGAYRRAAKAAELRSLRYQVNPHFLFNTLNSLSALVLTGKTQQAERMIQMLSTFYRHSLAEDPTADVSVRDEFALQRLYLDIESVRFPTRLTTHYDLPDALAEAKVPGMILQPLVENSVKHAIAPSSGTVTLTLSAREEYGRLVLTVEDDGKTALRANSYSSAGHGIGLANVRERLEARFGKQASIVSGPTDSGYATHIRIPLIGVEGYN